MSSTIENIPANPGILSVLRNNTKAFVGNMTMASGRVIKSGAPYVGSFVQAVVEKSPLGTVVTGLGLAATGVLLARRELSYRGNFNQCSTRNVVGYVALTVTGLGISTLGLLHIYGVTVGASAKTDAPVLVDLSNASDTKPFIEVIENNPVLSSPEPIIDNRTIAILKDVEAPLPQVAKTAASLFKDCQMSPLSENTSALTNYIICMPTTVKQLERVVPIKVPAPEVPGTFDAVKSAFSWLGKKAGVST